MSRHALARKARRKERRQEQELSTERLIRRCLSLCLAFSLSLFIPPVEEPPRLPRVSSRAFERPVLTHVLVSVEECRRAGVGRRECFCFSSSRRCPGGPVAAYRDDEGESLFLFFFFFWWPLLPPLREIERERERPIKRARPLHSLSRRAASLLSMASSFSLLLLRVHCPCSVTSQLPCLLGVCCSSPSPTSPCRFSLSQPSILHGFACCGLRMRWSLFFWCGFLPVFLELLFSLPFFLLLRGVWGGVWRRECPRLAGLGMARK